ncbi:MAG: hypothetical protein ACXVBJ_12395, partial [Flavisolibacter sp.]
KRIGKLGEPYYDIWDGKRRSTVSAFEPLFSLDKPLKAKPRVLIPPSTLSPFNASKEYILKVVHDGPISVIQLDSEVN